MLRCSVEGTSFSSTSAAVKSTARRDGFSTSQLWRSAQVGGVPMPGLHREITASMDASRINDKLGAAGSPKAPDPGRPLRITKPLIDIISGAIIEGDPGIIRASECRSHRLGQNQISESFPQPPGTQFQTIEP